MQVNNIINPVNLNAEHQMFHVKSRALALFMNTKKLWQK